MSNEISNVNSLGRELVRRLLPAAVRNPVWRVRNALTHARQNWQLSRLRRRMFARLPGTVGVERCFGFTVRINDGRNFYTLTKDIFHKKIYHFESDQESPLILDTGSNIGMSVLYFKKIYPHAKIIAFEPDPSIVPYLRENLEKNGMDDVQVVQAALAGSEGTISFRSDGKHGSCVEKDLPFDVGVEWPRYTVRCVRLREWLEEDVDFLKLHVEGAEWEVLSDARQNLHRVKQMIIEYHHLPGLERNLHCILSLLHETGFEYLVYDFDSETNPGGFPPFRLAEDSRYYLLVYARHLGKRRV